MLGNELMAVGDPVYKLSTDENWSVVIPIDAERGAQIQQEDYVKVRFLKNQYESWGQAKLFTGSDGNTFLSLTFTNSMVTFISDRFLDIELILNDETGLKIPNSSIVEKEFFLIDEDFVSTDETREPRVSSDSAIWKTAIYPVNSWRRMPIAMMRRKACITWILPCLRRETFCIRRTVRIPIR